MVLGTIFRFVCVLCTIGAILSVVISIKAGAFDVDYVIFCGFLLVGLLFFVFVAQGVGDVTINLFKHINIHLTEKSADLIGYVIAGAWGIGLYFFVKHINRKHPKQ